MGLRALLAWAMAQMTDLTLREQIRVDCNGYARVAPAPTLAMLCLLAWEEMKQRPLEEEKEMEHVDQGDNAEFITVISILFYSCVLILPEPLVNPRLDDEESLINRSLTTNLLGSLLNLLFFSLGIQAVAAVLIPPVTCHGSLSTPRTLDPLIPTSKRSFQRTKITVYTLTAGQIDVVCDKGLKFKFLGRKRGQFSITDTAQYGEGVVPEPCIYV